MSEAFRLERHPVVLLQPHVAEPYSWIGHIPFAYLAIDLLRPALVVELGTHSGNSYLAFCQAVAHLGLPTQCVAVDSWQGDAHAQAYGEGVLDALRAYHDPRYAAFSRLHRGFFDDAVSTFEDGSIDLLHIDGLHTYEAVRHDFETWLPKLSAKAVVLLHDTAVQERGFGVGQFLEELAERYRTFNFHHSNGLGVVLVGDAVPPAMQAFASAFSHDAALAGFLAAAAPDPSRDVAHLASATHDDVRVYFRAPGGDFDRSRESCMSRTTATGPVALRFPVRPSVEVTRLRIDPAERAGVFGIVACALLDATGEVVSQIDDVASRLVLANGDLLPPQAPSWLRWVCMGADPYVELDLPELADPEVAAVAVTIDFEAVVVDEASRRIVGAIAAALEPVLTAARAGRHVEHMLEAVLQQARMLAAEASRSQGLLGEAARERVDLGLALDGLSERLNALSGDLQTSARTISAIPEAIATLQYAANGAAQFALDSQAEHRAAIAELMARLNSLATQSEHRAAVDEVLARLALLDAHSAGLEDTRSRIAEMTAAVQRIETLQARPWWKMRAGP